MKLLQKIKKKQIQFSKVSNYCKKLRVKNCPSYLYYLEGSKENVIEEENKDRTHA